MTLLKFWQQFIYSNWLPSDEMLNNFYAGCIFLLKCSTLFFSQTRTFISTIFLISIIHSYRHYWQFCMEDIKKKNMTSKLREISWDRTVHKYITYKNSLPGLEKAVNIAPILERLLCTDCACSPVEDTGAHHMIKCVLTVCKTDIFPAKQSNPTMSTSQLCNRILRILKNFRTAGFFHVNDLKIYAYI